MRIHKAKRKKKGNSQRSGESNDMCKVGILAVVYWTEPKGVELGTLNIAKHNNSLIRYQAYYLPKKISGF